ncbi:MAG TPA: TrkA family potassium uptake protein [Chloroflexia bacterium]|nr:TrkA family potassium uptake protein [Chloroflexia bacterium]HYP18666.1 TrkA family potassium uptake protein [Chloroflexia bacterium]
MYVIIVGGGKVGYYLTKTLVNEGSNEILLIEKNPKKVATYGERFGSVVLEGDGAESSTLEMAGAARADVVIAVTGDDEDNLVICQTAKKMFNVPRTIARVNNPKNEDIFKRLGIDVTVSQTNVILSIIEQEIPERGLVHLMTLKHAQMAIVEATVEERAVAAGKTISDIAFPDNIVISAVLRDGNLIIPRGETILLPRDEVIALATRESEPELRRMLIG